ncbi:MAG: TetR/AcrR family transcriptional regulator [Gammaproteobacteria bacterium]
MSKLTAKQKILGAAQQLMTGRGYSATTVDEIVKMAGVAKGSFYHAFESKEELAIAALEDYQARGAAILTQGDCHAIQDPVKKALAFMDFLDEHCQLLWSHGCLLGSVCIEVADTYPSVILRIDQLFGAIEDLLGGVLGPALQARGVNSVTSKDLSVHLLGVIEGSIIAARSHFKPEYLNNGLRHFKQYLMYLLGEIPEVHKAGPTQQGEV